MRSKVAISSSSGGLHVIVVDIRPGKLRTVVLGTVGVPVNPASCITITARDNSSMGGSKSGFPGEVVVDGAEGVVLVMRLNGDGHLLHSLVKGRRNQHMPMTAWERKDESTLYSSEPAGGQSVGRAAAKHAEHHFKGGDEEEEHEAAAHLHKRGGDIVTHG